MSEAQPQAKDYEKKIIITKVGKVWDAKFLQGTSEYPVDMKEIGIVMRTLRMKHKQHLMGYHLNKRLAQTKKEEVKSNG